MIYLALLFILIFECFIFFFDFAELHGVAFDMASHNYNAHFTLVVNIESKHIRSGFGIHAIVPPISCVR